MVFDQKARLLFQTDDLRLQSLTSSFGNGGWSPDNRTFAFVFSGQLVVVFPDRHDETFLPPQSTAPSVTAVRNWVDNSTVSVLSAINPQQNGPVVFSVRVAPGNADWQVSTNPAPIVDPAQADAMNSIAGQYPGTQPNGAPTADGRGVLVTIREKVAGGQYLFSVIRFDGRDTKLDLGPALVLPPDMGLTVVIVPKQ